MSAKTLTIKHILGDRPEKYITATECSWWVRVYVGTNNKKKGKHQTPVVQKTFAYSKYDHDPEKALRAAKRWRNKWIRENIEHFENWSHPTAKKFYKSHSRCKSGVVGVHKAQRQNRGPAYVAAWREGEGSTRTQKAKQFGYKEGDFDAEHQAWKNAVRHRKQMEKLHYNGQINQG